MRTLPLLLLATGCHGDRWVNRVNDVVECEPIEEAFIQDCIQWNADHENEIQGQMDAIWANQHTTAAAINNMNQSLVTRCSSREYSTEESEGYAWIMEMPQDDGTSLVYDAIFYSVTNYHFTDALADYERYYFDGDYSGYVDAVSAYSIAPCHESAHFTTRILEHDSAYAQYVSGIGYIDEVTAWGLSSEYAAADWAEAQ